MNEELERLMREATPGPWVWCPPDADPDTRDMGHFANEAGKWICDFGDCEPYYPTEGTPPSAEDAALLVAAVNALPELLAKVKRLEEALATITNPATYSHSLPSCCQHTFDDACELFSDIARAALNQETKHD